MSLPDTYTAAEVGAMLGRSAGWVRRRARSGEFPHIPVGKSVRFTDAHIAAILRGLDQQPAKPVAGLATRRRRAA